MPREHAAAARLHLPDGMARTMRAMVLERPDRARGALIAQDMAQPEAGSGMLVVRIRRVRRVPTDLQR